MGGGGGGAMDIGPKPVKSHVDPGISEVPFFPRTDIEKDFSTMEWDAADVDTECLTVPY